MNSGAFCSLRCGFGGADFGDTIGEISRFIPMVELRWFLVRRLFLDISVKLSCWTSEGELVDESNWDVESIMMSLNCTTLGISLK